MANGADCAYPFTLADAPVNSIAPCPSGSIRLAALCDQESPEGGDLQCVLHLGGHEMDERTAWRAGVVDDDIRAPCARSRSANSRCTCASSWASHPKATAPVSAHNGASFAVSRAAMATARPSFLNSRVSDALNP
jgi:hypothetical protein